MYLIVLAICVDDLTVRSLLVMVFSSQAIPGFCIMPRSHCPGPGLGQGWEMMGFYI